MIAVVPVRKGELPLGAEEAAAEAGGEAVVIGDNTKAAAAALVGARTAACIEVGAYAPGAWATMLAAVVDEHAGIILPASADGRDLAPRLAYVLDRTLFAGAVEIAPPRVVLARRGGLVAEEHLVDEPFVATLEPGVRGVEPSDGPREVRHLEVEESPATDAEVLEVVDADPATMDLAEAPRIVAGGAGLGGPAPFDVLKTVAAALGATWGASRVAADAGWVPEDRFIGTTGVTVDARLYVALAISGAVQHISGIGDPEHIIAVNLDASAPMMAMADLAIVTDARALLDELAARLGDR